MRLLLTLVVLWSLVTPAHAADEEFWESGNNFLRYCSSADKDERNLDVVEVEQSMRCIGFMEGLAAGVYAEIEFATEKSYAAPVPFCVPDEVQLKQIVAVVLKYIRDNPEKAHIRASTLAVAALKKAFPCSLKK